MYILAYTQQENKLYSLSISIHYYLPEEGAVRESKNHQMFVECKHIGRSP